MPDTASITITTDDGITLDRTVLEKALKPLARYFIPKDRLVMREKALGRGGYGVVKFADLLSDDRSKLGPMAVAVKVLQTDDSSAPPLRVAYRLAREMIAWSACDHENILPFLGYFLSQDLETAYLVSPSLQNGNVKSYLASKQAKPEERLELVRDTLKGLQYLHTRNPPIIHGDLKSLNVLVSDDCRAVLCDFGLAAVVREGHTGLTTSSDFKGSTRWCSPEVLMGEERTLKSDIWGWGCLALEMMTGNPPYQDTRNDTRVILIVCGDPSKRKTPEPIPSPDFPNGLLDILRKCWDFEPDKRPDACTCTAAISPVPQTETVRVWEEARWLDGWIMQYIPMFEHTIRGCISHANLDADVAQKFCQLSFLSRMELEQELQEIKTSLLKDKNGQPLPSLTRNYLKFRRTTIIQEIDVRRQQLFVTATGFVRVRRLSTPASHSRDPVGKILRDISTLRRRVRLSREQVGETLRELHILLRDAVAPFDKSRYLFSALPGFERLVRHYPDDFHPDVASFLIDVYYENHFNRGNYALCLEVALQAAERYRELLRTHEIFLSRRARALDKVAQSYEILGLHENARAALAEAISVYRQLNNTTGNHQVFQIPLARTLVRYHQTLCRLGRDWNDTDVVDALREAIKIYDSQVWGSESQGNGLKQFGGDLAEALVDLDLMLLRKGDRVEALKVEIQLMDLYKVLGEVEQAADVMKRRDALLTMSGSASLMDAIEGGGG